MNTMVVKATGTISNPNQQNVVVGTLVTSDTFLGGNGEIYQRQTDCKLGGSPVLWRGFDGYMGEGIYEVKNNLLQATVKNGRYGVVGLDRQFQNLAVQFKVKVFDSGIVAHTVFCDVRRVINSTRVYRLSFHDNKKVDLIYRDDIGNITALGTTDVSLDDSILYIAIGSEHKVYINGILKITVSHTGYTGAGFVSLSRGNLETDATFGIDDLIIYSI